MHGVGRAALLLSLYRHEDDWRHANEWRRGSNGPGRRRAISASRQLFLVATSAVLSLAALAAPVAASPRSGDLQITKECSEYTGQAASFCTFVSSNITAIPSGARIYYYTSPAGATSLDTDVAIVAGPGNVAAGHCTLDFLALPGRCTFSEGTGQFVHFTASAAVSVDGTGLWHWDGTYSFSPHD